MLRWVLEKDGRVGVTYKGVRLEAGYPHMDGKPARPLETRFTAAPNGGVLRLATMDGEITLTFGGDENALTLDTTLEGFERAPHWTQPFARMTIKGADRFFKQGFGFGGPSGLYALDEKLDGQMLESYMATGLLNGRGETVVFGPLDNTRFLHRATLATEVRRFGLNDQFRERPAHFLEAGFSTEGVACGGKLVLPTLWFMAGDEPFDVFTRFAEALAKANHVKPLKASRYHFCSFYQRGTYFDMRDLAGFLDGLEKLSPKVELQTIQLDAGYHPRLGDWLLPCHKFPNTVKEAFDLIRAKGYVPGVWVGPFMVGSESELAKQHPDWLLRDASGDKIRGMQSFDGGTCDIFSDEYIHVLDTSHPGAFEHLRHVFATMREWGARFFKTDFLDWGFRDSLEVRRHTPGKTSCEYFMDVARMIRETIGEDSYWLACISPFANMAGLADGMRIDNDRGCSWHSQGIANLMRECAADHYMNGILWQNDPDVSYVRDLLINYTPEQREALAIWNSLLGLSVNTSDPFHRVDPRALALWRFVKPSAKVESAKIMDWGKTGLKDTIVRAYPGRKAWAAYVMNVGGEARTVLRSVKQLIGRDKAHAYEWGPEKIRYAGELDTLVFDLRPTSGVLWYLCEGKCPPPPGMSLGGD
ncbi:MAG: alpha-galactosidase [Kiritimatiellaeota bacterium]|nr:alpha-galactosidase [Kiritimatiellota bacterium]